MKQLFKTSLGFSVVLSSLATTVTAQTLEEVVVTAQKREQAITDVSIAMSAFTAEDMRSFRVEDATDIAQLLSNIDIKGTLGGVCLLYTSPSPRDGLLSRMPSSA